MTWRCHGESIHDPWLLASTALGRRRRCHCVNL
jgi:hypothetical protein